MKGLKQWFKKYFIPHEGNEHKPHFLRHNSMMMFFALVILIEVGFITQIFFVFNKTDFLASVLPGVLTNLTNDERAQNDAPPLVESALLDQAAQLKANDMATLGYFAHTSPEGKTPWYWFDQVGYHFTEAGENLAVNFFESEDVANAWMNSPTHRANIVKKDYKEIGIGVASGMYQGRHTVFVAQLFGTPVLAAPIKQNTPTPLPTPAATPKPTPAKPKPIAGTPTPRTIAVTPKPAVTVTPKVAPIRPTLTKVLGEQSTSGSSSIKSFVQRVLTSPGNSVAYAYSGIVLVAIIALLLAFFIKSEIRHPAILMRGLAMVAIVFVLLFVNFKILDIHSKVPVAGLNASVIAY